MTGNHVHHRYPLSPLLRRASLERMRSEHFDILVVGGGVVGAGAALDAATRGLSVALVEGRDFACGTSSRSSKLVHGGLRYLEMLDFSLVGEALSERGLINQRLAPHLVKPVPFLYPLRHRAWGRLYAGTGIALRHDGHPVWKPRRHPQTSTPHPARRGDKFTGALLYYDAQVDDAQVDDVPRPHCRKLQHRGRIPCPGQLAAAAFRRPGHRRRLRDEEARDNFTITASCVVNATGVWTADIDAMMSGPSDVMVRASKGVHLVVPRDRIDSEVGMILRTEKSVLFVIPWNAHWLIGTTDTDWAHSREHPASTSADIDYLLHHVNEVLASPLTRADVDGVYAGLRPLVTGASASTTKLSREHVVSHRTPGLTTVAGGKYTTYRLMARDVVDEAITDLPASSAPTESCTDQVPLMGAEGYIALMHRAARLAAKYGIEVATVHRLLDRYGSLVAEVLAPALKEPALLEPLPGGAGYLGVEILYAVTHEGALHLDDVLTRRTRISFEAPDRGAEVPRYTADLMAPILAWTPERQTAEVDAYLTRLNSELHSQRMQDDATADATRYQHLGTVSQTRHPYTPRLADT